MSDQAAMNGHSVVERIDISELTPHSFHHTYRLPSRPVVITGALGRDADWTLDFLGSTLGNTHLPARVYGKGHFDKPKTEWKKYCDVKQLPMEEYAVMLRDGSAREENVYMAQVPISQTPVGPHIAPTLEALSQRCDLVGASDTNMWLGPAGHTEPLHYDCADGTLMQLHGSKRVMLFSPAQTANLYPFPLFRGGVVPWVSQVYIEKPDFETFPRMRQALEHQIEVILEMGEILFIPVNWWHEVSAIGRDEYVCSINRFWKVKPFYRVFSNKTGAMVYFLSRMALAVMRLTGGGKPHREATEAAA